MPTAVTRHRCDWCKRKAYANLADAHRHEKRCLWNPVRRACITCGHRVRYPLPGSPTVETWCVALDVYLGGLGLRRDCDSWKGMDDA